MLKNLNKYKFLILTFLISLISILAFFHPGFPITDDGNWMIIRLSAFFESLKSGQIPVRFLLRLNNGFGYPVADFLYPLFLYLGSIIHILGFNFTNSIKILLSLSLIGSSLFTYFWLGKKFSNLAAFVGAVVFTFSPYLLFDVYKRGSVGEVLAIAILPFIFWQIEKRNIFLVSLLGAALISSHNILALLFLPLVFVYGLLSKTVKIKFILLSLVLAILTSSFFWLPAIYDTRYVVFNSTQVSDFYNYLLLPKDYNLLGLSSLVLLFSIFLVIKKGLKIDKFFLFSVVTGTFIIFLNLPISKIFWEIMPFKNLIQFPFRLLSVFLVLLAFEAAFIVDFFKASKKILIIVTIIIFAIISAVPFLTNIKYEDYPDSYYSTNLSTTTVKNEYMPKWVKKLPENYPNERVYLIGNEKINLVSVSDKKVSFNVFLNASRVAYVNIVYFPGWIAFVNEKHQEINYDNPGGLISLKLEKGENNVTVLFEETPVRLFADFVSIIGLILTIGIVFLKKYKKIDL